MAQKGDIPVSGGTNCERRLDMEKRRSIDALLLSKEGQASKDIWPARLGYLVGLARFELPTLYGILIFPGVAELADALDSKSSDRKVVMVRLHSPGPKSTVTVYTVVPQNPTFRFSSLHTPAQPTLQKAA
jgi:hypothetical protein